MYLLKDEQEHVIKSNLKGGSGDLDFRNFIPADMLYGAGTMAAVVTFKPGQSIGEHDHVQNFEFYYVLEGEATVTDDNQVKVLKPGDAEICANGHLHSIANKSDKDLQIIAVILNNFENK